MSDAYWVQHGVQGAAVTKVGRREGAGAVPIRQVGRWFERVHLAALSNAPTVEVLGANRPLRGGGRTLGELDLLYREGGRVVHREVAVKFYLAVGTGDHPSGWVGPGKKDSLELKLTRLLEHQCTLPSRACEAGAWPEELPFPDVTEVLLLGALFSPVGQPRLPQGASQNAEHGRWYDASEFAERFDDASWCVLDKPWWLSPEHAREAVSTSARELVKDLRRPVFVACVSGGVVERAFVVPDGWFEDLVRPRGGPKPPRLGRGRAE